MKRREAEVLFQRIGVTFAVCTEGGDPERLIPFDLIPRVRVVAQAAWLRLRRSLDQRARALNAFLHDVYHDWEIGRAGIVSEQLILHNSEFRPEMVGLKLPGQIMHISPESTWCAPDRTNITCRRITVASRRACPACWKTAR